MKIYIRQLGAASENTFCFGEYAALQTQNCQNCFALGRRRPVVGDGYAPLNINRARFIRTD
jgi:hypothetical protein